MLDKNKKTIKIRVDIIVEPDEGGFHAYCPALKGLHVGGDTEEKALQNARSAAIAYVRSLIKHNDPLPVGMVEIQEPVKRPSCTSDRLHHHIEDLAVAAA